ncbi:MAG: hypothetical protein AAGA92_02535 [Planctomycetota bacterium]
MHLRHLAIVGLLGLLPSVMGCSCPSSCRVPCTPSAPCAFDAVKQEELPPDFVQLVSASAEGVELAEMPAPDESFRPLEAADAQCYAATNSNLANMVMLERHWAKIMVECDTRIVGENLCLFRDGFALRASNMRNEAAAAALETFYQLAGLEARGRVLSAGLAQAEQSLERIDRLEAQGLDVPEEIRRPEIAAEVQRLRDNLTQLDYQRLLLNGKLQKLVGCPIDETAFFWPLVDWSPDLAPVDADLEVQTGLEQRTDLRALQLVLCRLEKVTLPVARALLGSADATLGAVEPREGLRHWLRCMKCTDAEVPIRCRQLALLYDEKEALAIGEIKSAVYAVTMHQERVALATEAVLDRQAQLQELEGRRDVDNVVVFEMTRSRGDLLQAESDLIARLTDLKVARIELKRARADLARECGHAAVLCCEGPCCGECVRCTKRPKSEGCRCK